MKAGAAAGAAAVGVGGGNPYSAAISPLVCAPKASTKAASTSADHGLWS